jgi:membrane-bound ClpP family serine protease
LPELAHRGIAFVLLALGVVGLFTELVSSAFVPRLVLFLIVLTFGAIGLARCRRIDQRALRSLSPGSQ